MKKENMTPELEKSYMIKLEEAIRVGYDILKNGGSSKEAVEKTIHIMENSPLFNAGHGAVLTSDGTAELDASFMDGENLDAGAIAGVTNVKNPSINWIRYSPVLTSRPQLTACSFQASLPLRCWRC